MTSIMPFLSVGWTTPTWAGVAFGIAAATNAFLWTYLYLTQDSREPPLAPCVIPIPFIGPVIEMRWLKSKFPIYMKRKFPKPIYTVRVPGKRFYFVNSASLIPAVQRQARILSFDPPLIQGVRSILGVSQATLDIMSKDVASDRSDSFLARLNRAVHSSLSAGAPALDSMNQNVARALEHSLSKFAMNDVAVVQLYDWVRKTVMAATTDTVFGPRNPFRDPANVAAWIEFELNGMPWLALDVLPDWAIQEGVRARETLVQAFDRYLAEDGQVSASQFIQRRISFYLQEGLPATDISRLVVADNIAFSSNLIPTEFWLLYHIFSDPVVLRDCRAEVTDAVRRKAGGTQTVVSFDHISNSCPILQSTLREVFRVHGFGLVPRRALEDHLLENQYLIKKEGTVLTPYRVQHYDPGHWGEDYAEFNYKRFLKSAGAKRHDPVALRGFGYGAHLCPGRHFAGAEMLLFTALVILRFDVVPTGGRLWPRLPVEKASQIAAVDQPDHDFEVEFRPRGDISQEGWSVHFSESAPMLDPTRGS